MSSNEILELLNQLDENSNDSLVKDAKKLIHFYHQQTQNIEKMETETQQMKEEVEEINLNHPDIDLSNLNDAFSQLYEMHHEKERQLQKIASIQFYCNELRETIQQRESDLQKIREKYQKILADIAEKELTNKNLTQSLANANASYTEANQRLVSQKKDIESKDSKISKLRSDIEEHKRTIENEQIQFRLNSSFSRKKSIDLKKLDHLEIIGIEFSSLLDDLYDPDSFFIAGSGRYLTKWKFSAGKEIAKADLYSDPIAFHIEPESSLISVSCNDNCTYVYNSLSFQLMSTLSSHQQNITDNCWITRNQLLTASRERTVQLYDVDQSRLHQTMLVQDPINTISYLGNMHYFMIADDSGCMKIIDIREENSNVNSLTDFGESRRVHIDTMVPNSLYEKIYALEKDSDYIYEIDIMSMKITNKISHSSITRDNKFTCITIDPFSHYLAGGTSNGSIILFDISGGVPTTDNDDTILKKKHDKSIICLKLGPNKLITADSHDLILWE